MMMKRIKRILVSIVSLFLLTVLLVPGGAALAMNKADKDSGLKPIIMQGTVTNIKDNIITVKDNIGIERQFELNSAEGIKIGEKAWCDEDCGKGLKIGDRVIRVMRVIGNAPSR
jgi:hypothetical protein